MGLNAITCLLISRAEGLEYIQRRKSYENRVERDLKVLTVKTEVWWAQANECSLLPEVGGDREEILL